MNLNMKISVQTQSLIDSLRKVLNIVSPRSTLPVLSNVLITAEKNELSLFTTDFEICITTKINAEVDGEGQATIPAKKFGQIISTLSGDNVTIRTNSELITSISAGKALFKIMGLNPSEFPKETEFQENQTMTFNKMEFLKILKKICYSGSTDQSRIILNGILLSIREGNLTVVATDGRRLALVEKVFDSQEALIDCDVILPNKVVNELQKLLDGDGDVVIKLSDSNATFVIDNTVLTTKLIEGSYPNYRQVIPASFINSIQLPRENFSEVLNRVSIVVNESGSSVKFSLNQDEAVLEANSSDIGQANESMQIAYEGDPLSISFNPNYLKDPLKALDCDELTLRFNDEFKPVVMLGDEGFLYVIMPMRS